MTIYRNKIERVADDLEFRLSAVNEVIESALIMEKAYWQAKEKINEMLVSLRKECNEVEIILLKKAAYSDLTDKLEALKMNIQIELGN